jgi:hypothetical protein
MASIIIDGNSRRRCDEACYDAKHLHCDCICGGALHGKGLAYAIEHAHEVADKINGAEDDAEMRGLVEGNDETDDDFDEEEEDVDDVDADDDFLDDDIEDETEIEGDDYDA